MLNFGGHFDGNVTYEVYIKEPLNVFLPSVGSWTCSASSSLCFFTTAIPCASRFAHFWRINCTALSSALASPTPRDAVIPTICKKKKKQQITVCFPLNLSIYIETYCCIPVYDGMFHTKFISSTHAFPA